MSDGSVMTVNPVPTEPPHQSSPNASRLDSCDDWTRMKDPRAKKRAQNRVAQRFYRQRMKARLEELETKLRMHEQGLPAPPQQSVDFNGSPDMGAMTQHGEHRPDSLHQYSPRFSQTPPMHMMQPDSMGFPSEHTSTQGDLSQMTARNLSAKPPHNDLNQVSVTTTNSNGSIQAVFPATLPPGPASLFPKAVAPIAPAQHPRHHSMPHPVMSAGTLAAANMMPGAAITFPKTHDLASTAQATAHQADKQPPTGNWPQDASTSANQPVKSVNSAPPGPNASMQERVEYFREGARALGFDDLDTLAETYYTAQFEADSPLANLQRISRNRHLPGLLASLRSAGKEWTDWERRGIDQEMVRAAEEILVDECNSFCTLKQFNSWLAPDGGQTNAGGSGTPGHGLQDELPNLWALLTALCAENSALSADDRSRAVSQVVTYLCGPPEA